MTWRKRWPQKRLWFLITTTVTLIRDDANNPTFFILKLSKSKLTARIFVFSYINLIILMEMMKLMHVTKRCSLLKAFSLFRTEHWFVWMTHARNAVVIVAYCYFLIILSLNYCTTYDRWTWLYYDQTDCGWINEWMNGCVWYCSHSTVATTRLLIY